MSKQNYLRKLIKEEIKIVLNETSEDDFINKLKQGGFESYIKKEKDAFVNKIASLHRFDNNTLESMWEKMKNDKVFSPEYAAWYLYLYGIFGK